MKKDNVRELLKDFKERGIEIWSENSKLKYKAPKGLMDNKDLMVLKNNKEEIINILEKDKGMPLVEKNVEERYYPFALTDVQSAYLLGRKNYFDYGGVSCRIYLELEYNHLESERVEEIWNKLIKRHDMLRAVISEDGYQVVLSEVPNYDMKSVYDNKDLKVLREKMSEKHYDVSDWPLFDVAVSDVDNKSILHFSIEFLIADWASIWLMFSEFEKIYFNNEKLTDLDLTFRDYLVAERKLKEGMQYEKARDYWLKRLDTMPPAPELPLVNKSAEQKETKFKRYNLKLESNKWKNLKNTARNMGITPTIAVMAAYSYVIEKWSTKNKFCLNLTVLNRLPLDKDVNAIVGDFTSINILEIFCNTDESFIDNARRLSRQLYDDLDHRLYSGVEVLRQMAKSKMGESVLMPIVFTSAIGLEQQTQNTLVGKYNGYGISKTPQVFIDCQAMDNSDELHINWDVREGVFPNKLVDDMFEIFTEILNNLASNKELWSNKVDIGLPKWQLNEIDKANNTKEMFDEQFLHTGIYNYYLKNPEKVAVIDTKNSFTYKELVLRSSYLIKQLKNNGCSIQDRIVIFMDKDAYQAIAALGVVAMGAVYVPIDIEQPKDRWMKIIQDTNPKVILSTSKFKDIFVDTENVIYVDELIEDVVCEFDNLTSHKTPAYIIYTSGTTGEPKGVVINHKAAINTILDINKKFNITDKDNILGLAKLSFDLSVYDIFGILSAGGTLIYPEINKQTDPSHWANLVKNYNITIWNSVPALIQMLVYFVRSQNDYILPTLRLAMLSGDWIPLSLPKELNSLFPQLTTVSLGGATEASIWSIYHKIDEVSKEWNSIPYGKPLKNQTFYILNDKLELCPYWCKGNIYIGGVGLADGYYNDKIKTENKFIEWKDNLRIYKTGDMGRYRQGGVIEFLGRCDNQVKIKGHRIELGEIESALQKHTNIKNTAVITCEKGIEKVLIAFIEPKEDNIELKVDDIKDFIKYYLPSYMIPYEIISISEMPLTNNNKINYKKLNTIAKSYKFNNDKINNKNKNQSEINIKLIKLWREVLCEEDFNEQNNFYEYGADSLIMAQMAGKIKEFMTDEYNVIVPFDGVLRQMINYPTIIELEKYLDNFVNIDDKERYNKSKENSYVLKKIYGKDDNNLTVMIHAGLGDTACYNNIISNISNIDDRKIICLEISDADSYCSLNKDNAIDFLANEYTNAILENANEKIKIVGYSLGGLLAVEIARRLSEKGIIIDDLSLIDVPPMLYNIEDELIIELIFMFNINVKLEDVEFLKIDKQIFVNSLKETFKKYNGNLPSETKFVINGEINLEINQMINKARQIDTEDRFKIYQDSMGENKLPLEMLHNLYRIFKQSFKISNFSPEAYFGDIRFFRAQEPFELWSENQEESEDFWRNITIGDLTIKDINGNHFTCIQEEQNAKHVTKLLLK